ncbi:SIR2 family protein [Rubrivivax sp. A210]|uniref:SIR2 family protein n=1 Tax=Rubrivivax sp. A210 TaxID=2772301 RepID=UPI00191A861A|nr:SIR2 family protein [Rubrivivax sp. A210]
MTNNRITTGLPARAMQKISDSAAQGRLVVVVGAGVSIGLTDGQLPSWPALIKNGFEYAHKKGRISDSQLTSWSAQLISSDIDELLGAAEFVGRKLGSPLDPIYGRWLEDVFGTVRPCNAQLSAAIRALASRGIPICTLNYDPLLEIATGLPGIRVSETHRVMSWVRKEIPGILHLHGSWDVPSSCILGIRDYETTQTDEVRDLIQRNLAAFNHLLFIGCGDTFTDPNFSALLKWLRTKLIVLTPQHVALTREDEVPKRNADPSWAGFVEPVSFGPAHKDLANYLLELFPGMVKRRVSRNSISPLSEANVVLKNYKDFLHRDCGQMTIEGVSADLDTGQRRFDLERLFVPLRVSACPPEFLPSDPDAAAKLKKWQEENPVPLPFGNVLAKGKRLVLLALPGGGKTLLLKRLAVAYSNPSRRGASTDDLPELPLLPLLIRCREWRDHIRLPIATLLKRIGDVIGQSDLSGFSEAITPLLKKGQVLLLVDGLDEIHNDVDRATFVEHLESFLDKYDRVRLVITSREAGFDLVAPSLSRFCERWRLAPLADDAIALLCVHWHRLMTGDTIEAAEEAEEVSQTLMKNASLRRLAENPLLLTMLLVVKHGAGGLPPDRVSLYGRAVDVLLDTWNIKGHDPLNAKEAVPQLAYVAFQMMCAGKQTATERELLALLEESRERHPNIKRYAKDSPHKFLKRVELRSSLLLEAGHQMEGGRAVPFYQFRHLTFQEYLAAVAATEGHYQSFRQDDTVLTPLAKYLLAEEWKEVVPMAAVLARKRAEPLLIELISLGRGQLGILEVESEEFNGFEGRKLEGAPGRLLQCLVEEAEASSGTISAALHLIALFAHGCKTADDWESLCRGPYGNELYNLAWELLVSRRWHRASWHMNSCAAIAAYQQPMSYWLGENGRAEVRLLLQSAKKEELGRGLLISMGMLWNDFEDDSSKDDAAKAVWMDLIEPQLLNADEDLWPIATWVWTNARRRLGASKDVDRNLLDTFLIRWLSGQHDRAAGIVQFFMSRQLGLDRNSWTPELSPEQIRVVRDRFDAVVENKTRDARYEKSACFFIAYHARSVWTDEELVARMEAIKNDALTASGRIWEQIGKELISRRRTTKSVRAKGSTKL